MGRHASRSAMLSLEAGLALTVIAALVPYLDRTTGNVLAGHIRDGYPAYSQARIDTAVTTYLLYLSVVGALGVLCWWWAIRAVQAGRRWARSGVTALFFLGTGVGLLNLLVRDTSGDTGLPSLLGWVGMAPSLAGLVAVLLLWGGSRPETRAQR